MHREDEIRLRHMHDSTREAIAFAKGKIRDDLDKERMMVLALVKEWEIIGEAAAKISQDTKARYPEIPWADIIGKRHRLIHAYFDVNLDIVWQTITKDLPPLAMLLEKAIFRGESSV